MKTLKPMVIALFTFALVFSSTMIVRAQAPTFEHGTAKEICADNTIMITFGNETFPFEIPSHGGCISTVQQSRLETGELNLTRAAFASQCRVLQEVLPSELWNAPVNIVETEGGPVNVGGFGGSIGSCIPLLEGYHTHTLGHN